MRDAKINQSAPSPDAAEERKPGRARVRFTISAIVLVVLIVGLVAGAAVFLLHAPSPQPTAHNGNAAGKPSGQWVTVQTFNGSASKKTASFTVSNNWRIVWSCDLASHNNADYYVIIHANTTTNTLLGNSVETTCSKNNTHSFSQMHQGGKVYLSILSQGSWHVQIQDLKK